ncbi:MAG TPA: 50S ribosomal protein L29 [Bacteroidales bacterium]|jgi:large subunit ribosomal protein L29|nr:50S ribosomal protein L29 [Bacteroidales bacterium]
MKAHELRDLSLTELVARIKDQKEAIQKLKFNRAIAGQLENPAEIQYHRREIARLETIIKEKQS